MSCIRLHNNARAAHFLAGRIPGIHNNPEGTLVCVFCKGIMSQKEGVDALVMEYLISRGYAKTAAELQAETGAPSQDTKLPAARNLTKQLLSNISEDVYVLGLKDKDAGVYAREYDNFRTWAVDSIDIVKQQLLSLCFPIFVHCYAGMVRLGLTTDAHQFMADYKQDYMEYYSEEMQYLAALTSSEQYKSDEFISSNTFISCMLTSKFAVRLSSLAYNLLTLFLVQSDSVLMASIINNKLTFKKLEDAGAQGQGQQEQLLVELPGYTAGSTASASDFVPIPLGVPGTVPKIQHLLGTNTTAATLAAANISLPLSKDDGLYRDLINKIVRPKAVLSSLNKRRRQAAAGGDGNNAEFAGMDSILDNAAKLGAFSIEAAVDVSDLAADGSAAGEVDHNTNKDARGRDKKDKPLARGAALEPSIIFATVTNAYESMTCLHMTPTLTQMASGHRDSSVRVWRLNPEEDLHFGKYLRHSSGGGEWTMSEALPKTKRMMQEAAAKKANNGGAYSGSRASVDRGSKSGPEKADGKMAMLELRGHSRAVYGVSQDCSRGGDDRLILSCSADESIRLWDTAVSQCVGKYSCVSPPWDVAFSPVGYHFASANQDKTATVFATDRITPLRLLTGHVSDVTTVSWHGNATLLATGSDDKTARLWDIRTSHSVRLLRGCTTPVSCTAISSLGNLLAAGTDNGKIYVWDLSSARPLAILQGHEGPVHSVAFSSDSTGLTSGGADCSVRVWDMQEVVNSQVKLNSFGTASSARAGSSSAAGQLDMPQLVLRPQNSYFTKFSPVFHVGYTAQNLLYAGGPFSLTAATASRDNKGENAISASASLSEQDTISALGISHAVQASH